MTPLEIVLIVAAYLLGSISSAVLVCRAFGIADPRTEGSNNPGATNALRIGGKKVGALTLIGDMLKGVIAVLVGVYFEVSVMALALIGFAAFIGHLYPVFFGFKGGKGVATYFGVAIGLSWLAGLITVAIWLVMAFLFKISSLSALVASLLAPLIMWLVTGEGYFVYVTGIMTMLLYFRHKTNIADLLSGKEESIKSNDDN